MDYNYFEAFSRNIGWLTDLEQLVLRDKHVAIAGLGGVGGFYLLTCCRLGIENFSISDFDTFELGNMNRQVGANQSTIGKSKLETLVRMAQDINPRVKIKKFDKITLSNVSEFLKDADIYLDGMDFFAVSTRDMIFKTAHRLKIPAITAAPIGMGVSYMLFTEKSMSFENYFQWKDNDDTDKLINFLVGLTPKPFHLSYLVDKSKVNIEQKKGPSTVMACMMCAGVTVTEALKVLLGRGSVQPAPYYHQFDAYKERYTMGYMRWGIRGPIQRLKKQFVIHTIAKNNSNNTSHAANENKHTTIIEKILDIARWAPSGDNTQPWKFDIINEHQFIIIVDNPMRGDFYDIDGKPTLKSIGCLIESIIISAQRHGYKVTWSVMDNQLPLQIEVLLTQGNKNDDENKLYDYLTLRSVNRYSYKKTLPSPKSFKAIDECIDDNYNLRYFLTKQDKKQFIAMSMMATQLRLVLKQPFDTHQQVINLNNDSEYGIPYAASGLSVLTQKLTKNIFPNWRLSYFMNHYLGGAFFASLELDYFPGSNSAGYFCLEGTKSMDEMSVEDLIKAGQQIQRLWLTLTQQGLSLQPCYTPIIISYYNRHGVEICTKSAHKKKQQKLLRYFSELGMTDKTIFIARFGYPKQISKPRSTRLSLSSMIINNHKSKIAE